MKLVGLRHLCVSRGAGSRFKCDLPMRQKTKPWALVGSRQNLSLRCLSDAQLHASLMALRHEAVRKVIMQPRYGRTWCPVSHTADEPSEFPSAITRFNGAFQR
jgi:hypothetical protein